MKEENYNKLSEWFQKKEARMKFFNVVYKVLPVIVMAVYGLVVFYVLFNAETEDKLRVILVPLSTFILCTLIRVIINEKRPYEILNITPLIKKNKSGQSFPSRHAVSASVIAMTSLYINVPLGIIMMIICTGVCVIRPIAGVHYIKDVVAGMIFGILFGIIGFYII